MTKAQGSDAKDVTKVVKIDVPNGWPSVHSTEELDQLGKMAGKYRFAGKLSNGTTVAFGSTSSTWRSKGSTGKGDSDPTIRQITVKGKALSYQVYPLRASDDNLRPYFTVVDLYQNYAKGGASTSGIMIDIVMLTLSDVDTMHDVLTQLAGVSEDEFKAFVTMCESVRGYWEKVTGLPMTCDPSVFNVTVSDGSTTPAATPKSKDVTDLTGLFD